MITISHFFFFRLNEGDAYYLLKDFLLLIQSIRYDDQLVLSIFIILKEQKQKQTYKWNNAFFFLFLFVKNRTSLSELCDDPNDNVLLAFQKLAEVYQSKFNAVWVFWLQWMTKCVNYVCGMGCNAQKTSTKKQPTKIKEPKPKNQYYIIFLSYTHYQLSFKLESDWMFRYISL